MKVLGITGGIGAGKSTVLDFLEKNYDARVIQADRVAFDLQQPGQECYRQTVGIFGTDILKDDGTIDRARLGAVVFADSRKLAELNAIVHPAVKEWIQSEISAEAKRGSVPFLVIEAALLLEDRYDLICDEIWYIHASEQVRTERLMRDRGYTREKALRIMQNQLPEQEYRKKCKLVIDNSIDFVENTYGQIDEGLREHGFL